MRVIIPVSIRLNNRCAIACTYYYVFIENRCLHCMFSPRNIIPRNATQRKARELSSIHARTRPRWHIMHKGVTWNDCNFNLIVRYFGRAYDYEYKGGRSLKRLRVAFRCHADELARFASPGLHVPTKSERIVENRAKYTRVLLKISIFSRCITI